MPTITNAHIWRSTQNKYLTLGAKRIVTTIARPRLIVSFLILFFVFVYLARSISFSLVSICVFVNAFFHLPSWQEHTFDYSIILARRVFAFTFGVSSSFVCFCHNMHSSPRLWHPLFVFAVHPCLCAFVCVPALLPLPSFSQVLPFLGVSCLMYGVSPVLNSTACDC